MLEYESDRMWESSIIAIYEAGYFRLWMCSFVRVIDILSRTFTIGIRNNRTEFFQSRDNEFSVPYLDFLTENLSSANESSRLWMWSNMKESECYDFRRLRLPIVDLPVCESHRFFIGDSHNRNTQQSRTYRGAKILRIQWIILTKCAPCWINQQLTGRCISNGEEALAKMACRSRIGQ